MTSQWSDTQEQRKCINSYDDSIAGPGIFSSWPSM
jgi:hypothetical protein